MPGDAVAGDGEAPAEETEAARPGLPLAERRHRGVIYAGLTVMAVFLGAVVYIIFQARVNQDAVPGTDAVASLAVLPAGFLVGTTGGLAASADGQTWSVAHLPAELVAVSSATSTAYVLAGGTLRSTTDLHTYTTIATGLTGTVLAAGPGGLVDVEQGRGIVTVGPDGSVAPLASGPTDPSNVITLAASPASASTLFAGSPISGLFRTTDGGRSWTKVLPTPTQAVVVDPTSPSRVLIGTAGGVLVSTDDGDTWQFTSLRLNVHALAAEGGHFFAVGDDRLVYGSDNGTTGWRSVAP